MLNYFFIIFFIVFLSSMLTSFLINKLDVKDSFIKRILIFLSIYYLFLISTDFIFPKLLKFEKNQKLDSGSAIKAKSEKNFNEDDFNSPIKKDFLLYDSFNNGLKEKKEKFLVETINGNFYFDLDSGNPISYFYKRPDGRIFELFNFENSKIRPLTVFSDFKTPVEFFLKNKIEDEKILKLLFSANNKFIEINKEYLINKIDPGIELKIEIKVKQDPTKIRIIVPAFNPVASSEDLSAIVFSSSKRSFDDVSKKDYEKNIFIEPEIIGFKDSYFVNLIIQNNSFSRAYLLNPSHNLEKECFVLETKVINDEWSGKVNWYFGPKNYKYLDKFDNRLSNLTEFGWLSFFAKTLIWFIENSFKLVKNYGIVIVLIVIFIKLITLPFAYLSKDSSKKRDEFFKKSKLIREKYKNDLERRNFEEMELIKKYGFIPGWLSYLSNIIQFPFIISLRRIFYSSIDYYEMPFFGWIKNLSEKDPFYIFPILFSFLIYFQISRKADTPMKHLAFFLVSLVIFFMTKNVSVAILIFFILNLIFTGIQGKFIKN